MERKDHHYAPSRCQKIRVHFVFEVHHCEKYKGRLVVDGHLTKEPMESVYSGVVSLRGLRLVTFLAELNKLLLWGGDVGNAYLEALTKEKLYIMAGPEFGELQGYILIIYTLQDMPFQPSRADPDIWMKPTDNGQTYEYNSVYVDDLCVASKDPGKIFQTLKHNISLNSREMAHWTIIWDAHTNKTQMAP